MNLVAGNALSMLCGGKSIVEDVDYVRQSFDSFSHSQAEVSEPLVVKTDRPVLTQELNYVGDDASVKSACK